MSWHYHQRSIFPGTLLSKLVTFFSSGQSSFSSTSHLCSPSNVTLGYKPTIQSSHAPHFMGKSQYSPHRMSHITLSVIIFLPFLRLPPWWYCVLGDTGSSHLIYCVEKRRRMGQCWRNLNYFRIQLNRRAADWLCSGSVPIRQVVTVSDLRARATREAQERAHKLLSFLCSGGSAQ